MYPFLRGEKENGTLLFVFLFFLDHKHRVAVHGCVGYEVFRCS